MCSAFKVKVGQKKNTHMFDDFYDVPKASQFLYSQQWITCSITSTAISI